MVQGVAKLIFVTPLYLIQTFYRGEHNLSVLTFVLQFFGLRPTRSHQNEIDGEHKYRTDKTLRILRSKKSHVNLHIKTK